MPASAKRPRRFPTHRPIAPVDAAGSTAERSTLMISRTAASQARLRDLTALTGTTASSTSHSRECVQEIGDTATVQQPTTVIAASCPPGSDPSTAINGEYDASDHEQRPRRRQQRTMPSEPMEQRQQRLIAGVPHIGDDAAAEQLRPRRSDSGPATAAPSEPAARRIRQSLVGRPSVAARPAGMERRAGGSAWLPNAIPTPTPLQREPGASRSSAVTQKMTPLI